MNSIKHLFSLCLVVLLMFSVASAQLAAPAPDSAVVPRLVNYSGKATDAQGKSISGIAGATFAIYKVQYQGSPLWLETQNIEADSKGNYTVQLGSTKPDGLPLDLFTSGEARWLGVTVNGGQEQPRVLLLSVPYALKAADAETIGGLPPSAFVLAAPASSASDASTAIVFSSSASPSPLNLAGSGTLDFVPLWTPDGNTLGNSALFQSGSGATSKIGINTTTPATTLDVNGAAAVRGNLNSPPTGTATAASGKNSQPTILTASAFNSSTGKAVGQSFRWQAEPAGNNTSSPSGKLSLLFGSGSSSPTETGFNIAGNGQITFAPGQSFPGTGTISGVTAGIDLTGGGTTGSVTLNLDTTKVPQLNTANAFTANQTINGTITATSMVGNGASLTNVNAASLNGLPSSAFSQVKQSNIYQSSPLGKAIPQVLGPVNNATASGGFNSNSLDLAASAFNSSSNSAQTETFRWQAEPSGNNSSSPSGKLNLLFGANGVVPTETGLSVASNGQMTFASGQAFPGTGTITGVNTAAGSGLMGGGNSGTLNLALTNTCAASQALQWNGSSWVCGTAGSVTSVGLTAPPSDFTVTGSPVTSAGSLGLAWTVPPDTNNTPNAIVKRDAFGNFTTNNITAGTVAGAAFLGGGVQATSIIVGFTGETGIISGWSDSNTNSTQQGVWGETNGSQPDANNNPSVGVFGVAHNSNATGVVGTNIDQNGAEVGTGVEGDGTTGVYGYSQSGVGVYALSPGSQAFVAENNSTADTAVITNDAGGFPLYVAGTGGSMYLDALGNLNVSGTIYATHKNFKIDHPLDPANKYLVHTSVESSEMMNIYTGNITTDGQGEARVELPDWFEALNTDFRYQLTVIGQFAQAIVAQEIRDHQFAIRTNLPNVKVSWQVTGVRQDPYAKAHPTVVEEEKEAKLRGYYIHPELYGAPAEMSIDAQHRSEWKKIQQPPSPRPTRRSNVPARIMQKSK